MNGNNIEQWRLLTDSYFWDKNTEFNIDSHKSAMDECKKNDKNFVGNCRTFIISSVTDDLAKPGEKLWIDVLEPDLYAKLLFNGKLVLGYTKYRKSRVNNTKTLLKIHSRSDKNKSQIIEYLKKEWDDYNCE